VAARPSTVQSQRADFVGDQVPSGADRLGADVATPKSEIDSIEKRLKDLIKEKEGRP
jgi:hypothetical protein